MVLQHYLVSFRSVKFLLVIKIDSSLLSVFLCVFLMIPYWKKVCFQRGSDIGILVRTKIETTGNSNKCKGPEISWSACVIVETHADARLWLTVAMIIAMTAAHKNDEWEGEDVINFETCPPIFTLNDIKNCV